MVSTVCGAVTGFVKDRVLGVFGPVFQVGLRVGRVALERIRDLGERQRERHLADHQRALLIGHAVEFVRVAVL